MKDTCDALAASNAALAREVAELRQKVADLRLIANVNGDWNLKYSAAINRAESAESANRALQAEVDRLLEALTKIPCTCILAPEDDPDESDLYCERCKAIAYTGTEPQEKP